MQNAWAPDCQSLRTGPLNATLASVRLMNIYMVNMVHARMTVVLVGMAHRTEHGLAKLSFLGQMRQPPIVQVLHPSKRRKFAPRIVIPVGHPASIAIAPSVAAVVSRQGTLHAKPKRQT